MLALNQIFLVVFGGEIMNVLITGSNGFIGRNVCDFLRSRNIYVLGLGRQKQSIPIVDEYICCDMDSEQINDIISKVKVNHIDAIIHLAADMRKEPHNVEVVAHNCVGTQRLLEFAENNNIGVFLQLSSLPVIGEPKEHPITEEHPLKPPTVYHATKIAEELLANYADYMHGIRTASFRISAPVGPGVNPNTIFPTFVKKAMNGEDLILSGKGTRVQTYIHVKDIALALYLALNNKNAHGIYNLSSYNAISNKALAELCIKTLKSNSKVVFNTQVDIMDDYKWDVSLKRIKEDIGYEPCVTLEEAIIEYSDYLLS